MANIKSKFELLNFADQHVFSNLAGISTLNFAQVINFADAVTTNVDFSDQCQSDLTTKLSGPTQSCYADTLAALSKADFSPVNGTNPDFKKFKPTFSSLVDIQMNLVCKNTACSKALVDAISSVNSATSCSAAAKKQVSDTISFFADPTKDPICNKAADGSLCGTSLLNSYYDILSTFYHEFEALSLKKIPLNDTKYTDLLNKAGNASTVVSCSTCGNALSAKLYEVGVIPASNYTEYNNACKTFASSNKNSAPAALKISTLFVVASIAMAGLVSYLI